MEYNNLRHQALAVCLTAVISGCHVFTPADRPKPTKASDNKAVCKDVYWKAKDECTKLYPSDEDLDTACTVDGETPEMLYKQIDANVLEMREACQKAVDVDHCLGLVKEYVDGEKLKISDEMELCEQSLMQDFYTCLGVAKLRERRCRNQ